MYRIYTINANSGLNLDEIENAYKKFIQDDNIIRRDLYIDSLCVLRHLLNNIAKLSLNLKNIGFNGTDLTITYASSCIGRIVIKSALPEYYIVYANSSSMKPTIDLNDIVILKRIDNANEVRIGDIVDTILPYKCQLSNESYINCIIHRVVAIFRAKCHICDTTFYITKGDNVESIDPYAIPFCCLLGKVINVIKKGSDMYSSVERILRQG